MKNKSIEQQFLDYYVLRAEKEIKEKWEVSPEILKIIWETYLQIAWIIKKS